MDFFNFNYRRDIHTGYQVFGITFAFLQYVPEKPQLYAIAICPHKRSHNRRVYATTDPDPAVQDNAGNNSPAHRFCRTIFACSYLLYLILVLIHSARHKRSANGNLLNRESPG